MAFCGEGEVQPRRWESVVGAADVSTRQESGFSKRDIGTSPNLFFPPWLVLWLATAMDGSDQNSLFQWGLQAGLTAWHFSSLSEYSVHLNINPRI